MTPDNKIISANGFKILKTTTALTGSFTGFVAWDDTVIAELDINGAAATLSDFGLDGTTIPLGMPIFFAEDKIITRIKLTSGVLYMIFTPNIKY